MISSWGGLGYGSSCPRRGTPELFRAYRESPYFHAVNSRLAHERATTSRRHLQLFDGPDDDPARVQISRTDPRYELLRVIRRPVRLDTGQLLTHRMRTRALALWYGLAGEAYVLKLRTPSGRVHSLAPLSPLWVLQVPTAAEPWYLVASKADEPPEKIPPEDIIPLVDPDAESPYQRGLGSGATMGDELDTDDAAGAMGRAVLQNYGAPSGLIILDGVDEKEIKRVRADWGERFSGPSKAGQIEFARGKAQLIRTSQNLKDSDVLEQRRFLREMFCHVSGVPQEVIGILDQSTRDSTWTAYYHFALSALVPWLELEADAYQAHLAPEFGQEEDLCVGYSSPVPEDRELQIRCVATAPSAFRAKDLRRVGGFAPDAELDEKTLGTEAQKATPSQLPKGPGGRARLGEPAWALALAEPRVDAPPAEPTR